MATSPFREALRDAARALQDGRWLIRPPDVAAATIIGTRLWEPYRDVLEAREPDPDRVLQRLEAAPAACEAALEVPHIESRFAELLRMLPPALAAADQGQAIRLLGGFGVVVHGVGNGPEVDWVPRSSA